MKAPRFLICDNDAIFSQTFEQAALGAGTEIIHTPFYTPQANGHCERLVGNIKHECFDHMLIFHTQQARRVMKEYTSYYNTARPHQGIRQKIPAQFNDGATIVENVGKGQPLLVTPLLNGLHHSYSWTAPQN